MPGEEIAHDSLVMPYEGVVSGELRKLIRRTVEDTLNALLKEEDDMIGAGRYERTTERETYRSGPYERGLTIASGQVPLKMPKLKGARFATAVIEHHKRREASVEEAIIEMYLAGVSTRHVSEILWDASVSAATVSELNDKAFEAVMKWRSRPLARKCPYVFVDGIYLERSRGGSFKNAALVVAIGVNNDDCREVVGAVVDFTESVERWRKFLSWLKDRGLSGIRLFPGDKAAAMTGAIAEAFPDAVYQRCTVHFHRNVLSKASKSKRAKVAAVPKAIHAQ